MLVGSDIDTTNLLETWGVENDLESDIAQLSYYSRIQFTCEKQVLSERHHELIEDENLQHPNCTRALEAHAMRKGFSVGLQGGCRRQSWSSG